MNTPVPRLIAAVSLSPSASVTVCTSCSSDGSDSVSVCGSSGLPVFACHRLFAVLSVNVTTPVAGSIWMVK